MNNHCLPSIILIHAQNSPHNSFSMELITPHSFCNFISKHIQSFYFPFFFYFLFVCMEGFHHFKSHEYRGISSHFFIYLLFSAHHNLGFRPKFIVQTHYISLGLRVRNDKSSHLHQVSFKKRLRLKGCKKGVHTHKVGYKRGILSNCFTLSNCCLRFYQEVASLIQSDHGENSRCHQTRFTVMIII